jgi:O-acetyl-ADP-ribose deacetylase (regulator of RNase III)
MRLILVDRGKAFCEVLRWQFRSHPEVQVVCGRFEGLPSFDCVVTAGNSFGLMDEVWDLAVVRFFGRHVMERIQARILADHLGEQPVGTSVIVPTDHPAHPFVAHAPTMRVPMNINPSVAQQRHERIYYGGQWGFKVPREIHPTSQ